MHLVVDVGNTETVLGLFSPGREAEPAARPELLSHWRVTTTVPRTADEWMLLLLALLEADGHDARAVDRVVLGSVVPGTTDVLRTTLAALVPDPTRLLIVDPDTPLPIRLDVEEPRTVGPDRIVNTLAASHLYARDTIAVDLGTATTFDCISAEGVFLGGVISPGVMAGQDWLQRRTAKLPGVELRPPERVIGRRTESCLHSGLFYSTVDAIDGIVRRIRDEWERPGAFVVATGGWAPVIAPHSATVEEAEPFLTLLGLELAGRHVAGG